jgi:hypothetical protein
MKYSKYRPLSISGPRKEGKSIIVPRLFFVRSDRSGFELHSRKVVSKLCPNESDIEHFGHKVFSTATAVLPRRHGGLPPFLTRGGVESGVCGSKEIVDLVADVAEGSGEQQQGRPASINAIRTSHMKTLLKKTMDAIPALAGHAAVGLPVALQQYQTSAVNTHAFLHSADQELVIFGSQDASADSKKRVMATEHSTRVNYFPPTNTLPPGSVVSPLRVPGVFVCTPYPHRLPFHGLLPITMKRVTK